MSVFKSQKSLYGVGITIIFVVIILALFVVYVDLSDVAWQLNQADWHHLVIASGLLVAGLIMFAIRWQLLLNNKPPWRFTFHSANIGHMFNLFLPLRSGEAVRIVVLSKGSALRVAEVTSSVIVEKLFEQIMRLIALGGAILLGLGLEVSTWTVFGAIVILFIAFGFLYWIVNHQQIVLDRWPIIFAHIPRLSEERASKFLKDTLDGFSSISSLGNFLVLFGISIITWLFFWIFHYQTLLALNLDLPLRQSLAISLGALAIVPPSASTIPGFYHASVVVPLVAIGFGETMLTAYGILLYTMQVVWMTLFGLYGLMQVKVSFVGLIRRAIGSFKEGGGDLRRDRLPSNMN